MTTPFRPRPGAVVIAVILVLAVVLPVAAADQPRLVIGRVSELTPDDANVSFPPTRVNTTSFSPCWYACFQFHAGTCDAGGSLTLSKSPALPFKARNYRRGTLGGGCSGTPVSFPVTLNQDLLIVDFEFTPTTAGAFTDSLVYGATPTGGTAGTLTFVLGGSGVADAIVGVASPPSGMVQAANATGGVDSYTLVNTGSKATTVTLSKTGDFFTQSPASFTLAAGGVQRVTLTGTAKTVGLYQGTSTPAGAGVPANFSVPVQLLVAAPPSGKVDPVPAVTRTDVSAPSSESRPTGSLMFTNRGTSGVSGFLGSDSTWLIPQSGAISLAPGQTLSFNFTIDRTKRPDALSPAGSVTGRIYLNFLNGPIASLVYVPNATPPPGTSGSSVVDTVKPSIATAAAPALATGESAIFLPSVLHRGSIGVDIILSNFADAADSGAAFFFTPAGSANTYRAVIGTMLPNAPVAYGDIVKNVYGSGGLSGSLQIRGANTANIGATAVLLNLANASGTFGTAAPAMRSDSATAAGGAIFLTGLQRESGTHTDLYIQELGGATANVSIEYFNASGAAVGTKTTNALTRFGVLELLNTVPSGAVSARITNLSGSAGKIGAQAIVYDDGGSDMWSLPATKISTVAIIPEAKHAHGSSGSFTRTDLSIMNTGSTSASGTLSYISPGRSRAIRRGSTTVTTMSVDDGISPDATTRQRSITLGALQTQKLSDVLGSLFGISSNTEGYVTFTPTTGTFAIANRTYETASTFTGARGTSVPPIPVASLLKSGQKKRIAGIDEAATRTAAKGGTYSTDFALMETSGAAVTVRVTLRYAYALETVQAQASATHDYKLAAREFLLVENIGSAIIGSKRASLGDLRNMQVEFQVISGTGAVAVYTLTTDNGSGDTILRTE